MRAVAWERLSPRAKRLAKMLARRRSRVRVDARGRIEVCAVVSCRILVRKRGSSELDLGGSKPPDHKHLSTAPGTDPESRSANRALRQEDSLPEFTRMVKNGLDAETVQAIDCEADLLVAGGGFEPPTFGL